MTDLVNVQTDQTTKEYNQSLVLVDRSVLVGLNFFQADIDETSSYLWSTTFDLVGFGQST